MTKNSRQLTFVSLGLLIVLIDQLVKALVLANLKPGEPVDFIGSIVRLHLVYNDSAAFSIGFGITWVFTIISTLAMLTLLWFSNKSSTTGWSLIGGMLLGGVVGNLIDRIFRAPGFAIGHVIDYIQIPFNFAIFNIADMAIVIACSISIIRIARGEKIGGGQVNTSA